MLAARGDQHAAAVAWVNSRQADDVSTLLAEVTREFQSAGVEVKLNFGQPAFALTEDAAADPTSRTTARTPAPVKDAVRRVA